MKFASLILGLCLLASCGPSGNNNTGADSDDTVRGNNLSDSSPGGTTGDTSRNTGTGLGDNTTAITVDPADSNFVTKAMMGGQMEVDLGNMASSQASSDRVKQFAAMMVRDHSAANDELKRLTGNSGMMGTMPKNMQATKDHLTKLNGAAFDKAYMMHMVSDHKKDVALFEKTSNSAKTPQIKDFATRTLPTLKAHLDSAVAVQKSLK